MNKNLRMLLTVSLLVALTFLADIFIGIRIGQNIKITVTIIFVAVIARYFGPLIAGMSYALTDIIQFVIKPTGPYHPGFTFNNFLVGLILGICLYKTAIKLWKVALACFLASAISVSLGTYWLVTLYNATASVVLIERTVQALILLPFNILVIWALLPAISSIILPNE